jgi:hypothetical protein
MNGLPSPRNQARRPKKSGANGSKVNTRWGTNSAWWIAERADAKGTEEDSPEAYLEAAERWVEAMFTGPRAALRPLYDQLLKVALSVSKDVKACPGKTAVALYRKHVFAQIKVATKRAHRFRTSTRKHENT